jgi:hypothetical protein
MYIYIYTYIILYIYIYILYLYIYTDVDMHPFFLLQYPSIQVASNFSTSITATFRSGRSARSARARPQMGAAVGSCARSPGRTETPEAVRNLGGVNDWGEDWAMVG